LTTRRNKTLASLSKPTSIIAVDASTNSMAFSVFEDGRLIKYGKVRFVGADALYKAGDACKKAIPFFKAFRSDAIVLESAIYSNSPKTAMQLSLVQGAIIAAAQVAGIKTVKTVAPMAWQNYVGTKLLSAAEKQSIEKKNPGKSKSWYKSKQRELRKKKTMDYVNKRYGIKIDDDDVADAIGIGSYVSDRWGAIFE